MIINLLEPLGFELKEATNGQEGIEIAREFQPDLILADLVMPVIDGYEMTRQLRQLPNFQTKPIITISANAFEVDRQKSLDSGCNHFLSKPVQAENLLNLLQYYLKLSWIYDQQGAKEWELEARQETSTNLPQTTATKTVVPPIEELQTLYESAKSGYVTGVEQEIIRLQQLSPDYTAFITKVLQFAEDYDYEEIVELIEGC